MWTTTHERRYAMRPHACGSFMVFIQPQRVGPRESERKALTTSSQEGQSRFGSLRSACRHRLPAPECRTTAIMYVGAALLPLSLQ